MPRSPQFDEDEHGRTALFREAENGRLETAKEILFSLMGTGVCCERLALIDHRDKNGDTAIDVAKRAGRDEVVQFLVGEKGRMEFFE